MHGDKNRKLFSKCRADAQRQGDKNRNLFSKCRDIRVGVRVRVQENVFKMQSWNAFRKNRQRFLVGPVHRVGCKLKQRRLPTLEGGWAQT
jgi:hypothetical protein